MDADQSAGERGSSRTNRPEETQRRGDGSAVQYATFVLDGHLLGVPVLQVQEVLTAQDMTTVPLAPAVVAGLINLRGQIVMALDLRTRLGFPACEERAAPMNVVVQTPDGPVSLVVDRVGDVIEVAQDLYTQAPETVDERLRAVTAGVYKLKDHLLLVLDIERATQVAVVG